MSQSSTRIKAIVKREFSAYFNSSLAYVFLTIFLVLGALFTFNFANWFEADEASLRVFFSIHPYLYLFFIPALGMRVWAEEEREGTLELLLTLPISAWHAVVGKFIAGWLFLGFALFLTFPMLITLFYLGEPDIGRLFSGYLGSFMAGGMCFAISSLTSAFTRNQVISFLFGFIALLIFTVIGMPQLALVEYIRNVLPQTLVDTLQFFSLQPHVEGLEKGVLDLRDIIYFFSFICFGMAGATAILRCRKAAHKHNRLFTGIGIFIFGVIVLLVNFLCREINFRKDLSADKLYTLTPSTKVILSKLDSEVAVRFYFSQSDTNLSIQDKAFAQRITDLLHEYQAISDGRIKFSILDPKPGSISEKSAALDGIEPLVKANNIKSYLGISVSYKDSIKTIPMLDQTQEKMLEYHLTHLFKELTSPKKPVIGVLTDIPVVEQKANPLAGQYENSPAWKIIDEMRKDYDLISIEDQYADWGRVDGTNYFDLVIIYKFGYMSEASRFALDQYLLRGGKAIIITDPFPLLAPEADKDFKFKPEQLPYMGNTLGIIEAWKVRLAHNYFIVDEKHATQMKSSKNSAVLTLNTNHLNPKFKAVRGIQKLIFPYSGYFEYETVNGISKEIIVQAPTTAGLVLSKDYANKASLDKPQAAKKELPIILSVKGLLPSFYKGEPLSKKNLLTQPKKESEVILIADMDFLKDSYSSVNSQDRRKPDAIKISENCELFLNLLDAMVTDGDMIDVRMRQEKKRDLNKLKEIRQDQRKEFLEEIVKIQQEYLVKEKEVKEFYRKQENQIKLSDKELEQLKKSELELRTISDRLNEIQFKFNEMDKKTQQKFVIFSTATVPALIILTWLIAGFCRKKRGKK